MSKPRFLGWQDPPEPEIPSGSWKERLLILAKRPDTWARFGPYASSASIMSLLDNVYEAAEAEGLVATPDMAQRDDGRWDLYVKVSTNPKERP